MVVKVEIYPGAEDLVERELKARLIKLGQLKAEKKRAERVADAAKAALVVFEAKLWEDMEESGVQSMGLDSGKFVRKSTVYGQVTDLEALVTWCEENGVDDLVKTVQEKGRLNELVRAKLDTQEELPPGVSFYESRYISHTQTKTGD
jgi:hypothetical protein